MSAVQVVLVAALDRNYAIGRDGAMPWHLPEDLKRFKQLTLNHPILMGSKTARAIGRVLPGRRNIVLTRSNVAPYEGQLAVDSIEAALAHADSALYVIGGGEVYALALARADRLHLTWVDTEVAGADAHFPRFDARTWQVTSRAAHAADARHAFAYEFIDYARIRRGDAADI